jgi:DNA (cytosine-5)-methyltransferase 1
VILPLEIQGGGIALTAETQYRVAELFAGVGGFRLGLERVGWNVVWSNQWEPGVKSQHASDIYVRQFGTDGHVNQDIAKVLDLAENGQTEIPDFELLCGGFPCQDYSVAKTLNMAAGIQGKKGVLWWEIMRLLRLKRPPYILLENVDRLLKSPVNARGRDFAIILACLSDLGYTVEWRIVNAADYGFPQRRRRVFIVGYRGSSVGSIVGSGLKWLTHDGVLAKSLACAPVEVDLKLFGPDLELTGELDWISDTFGRDLKKTPFENAGVIYRRQIWTRRVEARSRGKQKTIRDVLQNESQVPEEFFIPEQQIPQWKYLKGGKREPRKARNGHEYFYSEGPVTFPDPLTQPSRTILTGEGGSTPSRFKHVVETPGGRLRRLTPVELERLNGFPANWTAGASDGRRAFLMGNALVVGVVERIGRTLRQLHEANGSSQGESSIELSHARGRS